MSARVIGWTPDAERLGPSIVAIGVFDGVHLGHQALLRDTARHAHHVGADAVALTFDRDPDQVVTPDTAAAQLLTLRDKCEFIGECGIDTVIVIPFTDEIASTPPEEFLERVLGSCCEVRGIHVGEDFRFGARAAGDIDTLYVWGVEHGIEIEGHGLVYADDEPITSTRIRSLVARGLVAEAAKLLGRPTRVAGTVHRGRGEGRAIGFATANLQPIEFAAVPADGVYAGRAFLEDGSEWPAAISTGRPPMFPEATDSLEAYLIGFDGDLYGQRLALEFLERLRDQRPFGSVRALAMAIEDDVSRTLEIASREPETSHDGEEWVEDPVALEAAEKAVAVMDPESAYDESVSEWVELAGPRHLSGMYADAGFSAALISAPLDAAGIPHAWDPYPPERMPGMRIYGLFDTKFTLLVPADRLEEAKAVMRARGIAL